ncbi:MAG: hypothetical protein EBV00_06635 [Burkholderiaceae bacterium]|nr:hypothetical protein [Burkholderiaceae bacterium]
MPFIRARFLGIATPPDVSEGAKMENNSVTPLSAKIEAIAEQPPIAAVDVTVQTGEGATGSAGSEKSTSAGESTAVSAADSSSASKQTEYGKQLSKYLNIADGFTVECTPEGICLVRNKTTRVGR